MLNYGLNIKEALGKTDRNNDEETLSTYGHELANYLDIKKNRKGKKVDGKKRSPGYVYGNPGEKLPDGRKGDTDTGQQVENCMKKK